MAPENIDELSTNNSSRSWIGLKLINYIKPAMVERAKVRFNHLGFQVITGTRYLGGFGGVLANKSFHIRAKVGQWATGITRLATVTRSPPPSRLHSLPKSLPA